jgi:hypothetical protein
MSGLSDIGSAFTGGQSLGSFASSVVKGVTHMPKIHDWHHANQIFSANNYELAPKQGFLFHVKFDYNGPGMSRTTSEQQLEAGMMVKNVQIPKYTIDTKTMNAYNRSTVIQQKLKYDPITITFHDDSSDVVRSMWYDYMSHYYRDTDYTEDTYTGEYKYNSANKNFWGYQPTTYASAGTVERLINAIRIYSLHQKQFSEYILINPMITSFQHGQHQQGSSEFMEHTMTVAYETVLYNYGSVKMTVKEKEVAEPRGFATHSYDKKPSPLTPQGGGTNSILGPGGALSSVQGVSNAVSDNNWAAAAVMGVNGLNNAKTITAAQAGYELKNIADGILRGDTNVLNRLAIPKASTPTTSMSQQNAIQE